MNWNDISLESDNRKVYNIFQGNNDFYLDYIPILNKEGISRNSASAILTDSCYWGKCKFCTKKHTNVKFVDYDFIEEYVDNIITYMKKIKVNILNILDPEFCFTDLNQEVLNRLRDSGYPIKIIMLTSIRMLKNDKHFNMIFNKYKDMIVGLIVGTEYLNDFGLKLLNKGSTVDDYFYVMRKVVNYNKGPDPIIIRQFLMINICDRSIDDIKINYDNLITAKHLFESHDQNFATIISTYMPLIGTDYHNSKYIKLLKHPLHIDNQYIRLDEDGNTIPSDNKIIDSDIYDTILGTQSINKLFKK